MRESRHRRLTRSAAERILGGVLGALASISIFQLTSCGSSTLS